jgi:hypothetical protein
MKECLLCTNQRCEATWPFPANSGCCEILEKKNQKTFVCCGRRGVGPF